MSPDPRLFLTAIFLAISAVHIQPVTAQTVGAPKVSEAFVKRANDVLRFLQTGENAQNLFSDNFLDAVPPSQLETIRNQLIVQYGPPQNIKKIIAESPNAGAVEYQFGKAVLAVNLVILPEAPQKIAGLLVTGVQVEGDSLAAIIQEFRTLPGRAGFALSAIDKGRATRIAAHDNSFAYATGSSFKLYILAELDRAVRAGERNWHDVALIGPKSHPSGILQNWQQGAPATLHSLAQLMISRSDNTATDTLIRVIGQRKLAAILETTGHHNPDIMKPFLMTRQVSALKMRRNSDIRDAFLSGTERQQAKTLTDHADRLTLESINEAELTSKPNHISTIEWFATPDDMVRLLAWLDDNATPETQAIMAVNPGIGPGDAARWNYLGYKGGSEPGVIALNFIVHGKNGARYSLAMSWNNEKAAVDNAAFVALATRILNLIAGR